MLTQDPTKKNINMYKKRCRKGIPDSIRGYAWKILINGD